MQTNIKEIIPVQINIKKNCLVQTNIKEIFLVNKYQRNMPGANKHQRNYSSAKKYQIDLPGANKHQRNISGAKKISRLKKIFLAFCKEIFAHENVRIYILSVANKCLCSNKYLVQHKPGANETNWLVGKKYW